MLSCCLIVRNEERVLARCLASVAPHVDELIVVDTGSTDSTRFIARTFTEKVYDFEWCDDFAAARQFSFDQATGDWLMWLDADDVLHGGAHIKEELAQLNDEANAVYFRYVAYDEHGNKTFNIWRERIVRSGTATWAEPVHEVLRVQPNTHKSDKVVVEHRSHKKPRLSRNLHIMLRALKRGDPSPRLLFYLGRDLYLTNRPKAALRAWQRYLPVATYEDELYGCICMMADAHRILAQWDDAANADLSALKIRPLWPDAYFGLARTAYFNKDWPAVAHWTEIAQSLPDPDTLIIRDPLNYRFNWIIYYVNALWRLGRKNEALEWTHKALAICPDDPLHLKNAENLAGVAA